LERTLIILKPDAVQRGLVGEIIRRLERRGLRIVALKFTQIAPQVAERHYAEHQGKPFYPGLIQYITSGPVLLGVLEGKDAILATRTTMGATNPVNAAPGTIRGDLALETGRNLIHGSANSDDAAREVGLFFHPAEISAWERTSERWIHEV
jgi:nucleoside-diphosphate kinase